MSKTKYEVLICTLIIASLALLPSCAASPSVPEVKHNPDPLWEVKLEGANPEFLEDYIYLWDLLENEYPFLAAAERITGKDAQVIKEKYYTRIPTVADPLTFMHFIIAPCLNEFEGAGHLTVVSEWLYSHMYTSYADDMDFTENNPRSLYNYSQLKTPETMALYSKALEEAERWLETAAGSESNGSSSQAAKVSDNLSFSYYPERSAGYVNINSMTYYPHSESRDNPEYYALEEFFITLEAEGYENCIIDIRNNSGGSDLYWMDMIVAPNLKETLSQESVFLIRGNLSRYYIGELSGYDIRPLDEKQWSDYVALNLDDLEMAENYTAASRTFSPLEDTPLFSGRYWLLVGPGCYSSSESFLQFCQATGFATLVGRNTGGDGGGIDPISVSLPNTGILLRFSTMLGLNPDGSGNEEFGTKPDYLIAPGEDALVKCLEVIGANN